MTQREEPATEAPPQMSERRRPGRMENPSPELIALMRTPSAMKVDPVAAARVPDVSPDGPDRSIDNRDAARGIMVAVALGLLLWGALIAGVWLLGIAM